MNNFLFYNHNTMMSSNFNPFAFFGFLGFLGVFAISLIALLMIVVIVLKGYALWNAAKRDEKGWFIALLIINTLGILELCYLYFVVGKWNSPKIDKKEEHHGEGDHSNEPK